jgi:hypothetical protein
MHKWTLHSSNGTVHIQIKAHRGQLWKGKQNENSEEKFEWNIDGVKYFTIINL